MHRKIRTIGIAVAALLWLALTVTAWISPAEASSDAERRPLAQFPEMSVQSILNGQFMSKFEEYSLDQFPLRDGFRMLKSLFHNYVLNQKDNNDIYIAEGFAVKQEYPLNADSVEHAAEVFRKIYESYLKEQGSAVFSAVIPDKGYYLAEKSGHLSMDYDRMNQLLQENMPWAVHIDLTDCLQAEDYYFTDTHWRQEKILPVAQKISAVLGVTAPKADDFRTVQMEKPFYGVYYGQAALPMSAEEMYYLQSDLLEACQVYDYESGKYFPVYNMDMLRSKDLYDIFLSGAKSLLRIENPNATTDRELIIFRDSFGSSLSPLLVQEYQSVTLIDIRYISSTVLEQYVEFHGQDVLFLYSTLVLNSDTQRMR